MTPADQRAAALNIANDVRRQAAEIKRQVANGELGVIDVLHGHVPDDLAAGAGVLTIDVLLMAAPGIGPGRARRILRDAHPGGSTRVVDVRRRPLARDRLARAFDLVAPRDTPRRTRADR
ncbi:MAG: hypothetical protein M0P31_19305 [Solirubrobacteraceae bacterium]|nr:hypothetical protein [Solirubrobacteraceae bacterium]